MSFASDIKKFALGAGVHTDEAVRAFNTEITRQVIQLTPVGNPDLWKTPYPPEGYTGGHCKGQLVRNYRPAFYGNSRGCQS